MEDYEKKILAFFHQGLPLCSRPYEEIARKLSLSESDVLRAIENWKDRGLLKRFGVVLHHDRLGYKSNAMVVFEIPEEKIFELGQRLGSYPFVRLCYRRLSRQPWWPYNLYCMIHGKERSVVQGQIEKLLDENGLRDIPHEILFTKKKLKQHGPRYFYRDTSLDELDRKIVSRLQRGITTEEEPFRSIAGELEMNEEELLGRLKGLVDRGTLSRFGPLLNAQALGGGVTLAAMSVPEYRFEEVAEMVNSYIEVGHNYERDHRWNMWFVLLTEDKEEIGRVQRSIAERTGLEVRLFPKEREYYLNLQL